MAILQLQSGPPPRPITIMLAGLPGEHEVRIGHPPRRTLFEAAAKPNPQTCKAKILEEGILDSSNRTVFTWAIGQPIQGLQNRVDVAPVIDDALEEPTPAPTMLTATNTEAVLVPLMIRAGGFCLAVPPLTGSAEVLGLAGRPMQVSLSCHQPC